MVGSLLLVTGVVGLLNVSVAALAVMLRVKSNAADVLMWALVGIQLITLSGVLAAGGDASALVNTAAGAFALLLHAVVILFAGVTLFTLATGDPHS